MKKSYTKEEFERRFLESEEIDLSEEVVGMQSDAWLLEVSGNIYEQVLVRIQKLLTEYKGGMPLYMLITTTGDKVLLGNIEPSIEFYNKLDRVTKVMNSRVLDLKSGVDHDLDLFEYIEGIRLEGMTANDYFV